MKEFDSYNKTYSQTINKSLGRIPLKIDFFTRVKANYLLDILSDKFSGVHTISALDIGCGIGNYHSFLSEKIGSVYGVDVSETCITEAKKNDMQM